MHNFYNNFRKFLWENSILEAIKNFSYENVKLMKNKFIFLKSN